ncbi:Cuticle protein 10.9 like protein [Argiope bruennichi]|uniref:Cuticle protein 10.9 like protein n=1 Tax=Argiope bruennichi TaxID=94029 RepID=A0A8T0E7D1_ARGBR|nr:Cuticle protein 10.9 like protein [Argiope bruennichi]
MENQMLMKEETIVSLQVDSADLQHRRGFPREVSQDEAPQPYNFDYQSSDEQGNSHYHRAEADASGTVRGSYGYTDIQGLYRVVDYIADANGFRASIRTNEPGTDGKESPADVQMIVEQPPFGIQDRYKPSVGRGSGAVSVEPVVHGNFKSGLKPNVTEESDQYEEDKNNKS